MWAERGVSHMAHWVCLTSRQLHLSLGGVSACDSSRFDHSAMECVGSGLDGDALGHSVVRYSLTVSLEGGEGTAE